MASRTAPGGRARILVIDDNAQNVALIRAQLGREGYDVDSAANGMDGLEAIRRNPPDLVLLDIMMPGMDGYQVCKLLKSDDATRTLPVVMLTALKEKTDRIRALECGADDFLTKPVDRAELLARAGSLVRLKACYDEITHSRDVLARQAHLLAVEKSRADAILRSVGDGILTTDLEARVQLLNPAAEHMAEVVLHDVVGCEWRLALDARDVDGRMLGDDQCPIRQTLLSGRTVSRVEIALGRRRGQPVWVNVVAAPVRRAGGEVVGAVAILRDITQARDLARTKDEVVSVVSHELRTPLASLVGFAELLLSRQYSEEQQREFLAVMLEEGRRLTNLINDFLDLQRMESGRQEIAARPTALPVIIERALAAMEEDPRHPVVLDFEPGLPPVSADRGRIQQVLVNLVSNARKYSPAGCEICISACVVDEEVEVSITDQGLGLPPEALPQLFAKFFRVDNSDRREIKGTGLGLAICRKIVEAHGGRIWAESDGLGHGTRVAFTLPKATAEAAHGDVLVVEDDPGFARLLEAELVARGLSTVRAASAEAALERLLDSQPRAVLLDLMLPGLRGEDFLERLRERHGPELPVVVVTVKDLSEQERHGLERLGAVSALLKGPGVATKAADVVGRCLQLSDL